MLTTVNDAVLLNKDTSLPMLWFTRTSQWLWISVEVQWSSAELSKEFPHQPSAGNGYIAVYIFAFLFTDADHSVQQRTGC